MKIGKSGSILPAAQHAQTFCIKTTLLKRLFKMEAQKKLFHFLFIAT